jgi:hypothetical protein
VVNLKMKETPAALIAAGRDPGEKHVNPRLRIPLEDFEAHMSMASVAQAQPLADILGR